MPEHNHEIAGEHERLIALVDRISAYIEQYHGGSVEFVSYQDNVLKVKMGGACQGCALTETTLKGWVSGTVHQFFPDVEDVVAV